MNITTENENSAGLSQAQSECSSLTLATEWASLQGQVSLALPDDAGVISHGGLDKYRGEGREISFRVQQLPIQILTVKSQKGSFSESCNIAVLNAFSENHSVRVRV